MSHRIERLNSEMAKSISDIIQNRLKDPRLTEMVSITGMDTTKDLKYAKVFISIYADTEKAQANFEVLNSSAGFIRKELAKDFKDIRTVPQLTFVLDTSREYSEKIGAILDSLKNNKDL